MNQLAPVRQNAPAISFTGSQLELIRKTVAGDTNQDEFNLFMEVAKLRGLNPLLKQIYAVVYSKDEAKKRKMSIITGIDGYRIIAARCRDYRPMDQPTEFEVDATLKSSENPHGIVKAVTRGYKFGPDGAWHPVVGEAFWDEYVPIEESSDSYDWIETGEVWPDSGKPKKKRVAKGEVVRVPAGLWARMPRGQIAKCSEAQMLRKGWPEDFSGVYVAEEMDRARVIDLTASEALEEHERDTRMHLTRANDSVCIVWEPGKAMEAVPIGQFADEVLKRLPSFTSVADLNGFLETNRVGLNHFWAKSKSDALELKKKMEARRKELDGGAAA